MRILCERDEAVARLLCAKVEQFTADLPLADKALEFMSQKEHGCKWTESTMTRVVPGEVKRLFAAVRTASSRGPAKAKLFFENMIQIGKDGYTRRNHRLTKIMQPPPRDRRNAVYAFVRGDTPFCPPAGRVRQLPPWNPFNGLLSTLQAAFQRAPLHALLVSTSYITHVEAMSTFPHWMAAAAQAFSHWIESWVAQEFPAFRERSHTVSAQCWATIYGTMVRGPDGRGEPWPQVSASHPAVGYIMGSPREVLPILQQPLCFIPVLGVATVLDVEALWLYDRQLHRIILVAEGQRSMAVLVGSKKLARIQGDDALGRVTEVLLSLPEGDDKVAADAHHTLDALDLGLVVEAQSGGQRFSATMRPAMMYGRTCGLNTVKDAVSHHGRCSR